MTIYLAAVCWQLQLGNDGLTAEEQKSHYTLWALMNSPLLLGTDITNMAAGLKALLLNAEIAALNQDTLGYPGRVALRLGNAGCGANTSEVWEKKLADGSLAAVLFNRCAQPANVTAVFAALNISWSAVAVRDLWAQRELGSAAGGWSALVPPHGVVALRLSEA